MADGFTSLQIYNQEQQEKNISLRVMYDFGWPSPGHQFKLGNNWSMESFL
jgi:hypothetical protein